MKKILSYLQYKEILFPFIGFILSIILAYCAKRFITGNAGNMLCMLGCISAMSMTELMAKYIAILRQEEYDKKNKNRK